MNRDKTIFQPQGGRFSLCSVVLDKDSNTFQPADESEQKLCCLNSCKSSVKTCLELCNTKSNNEYVKCHNDCARNIALCEDMCAQVVPNSWRNNNPLIQCIKDNGLDPNNIDQVKENKELLVKCCTQRCVPSKEVNCSSNCIDKYNNYIGDTQDPLQLLYKDMVREAVLDIENTSQDYSLFYYLITVVCVLIIIILYLYMKK